MRRKKTIIINKKIKKLRNFIKINKKRKKAVFYNKLKKGTRNARLLDKKIKINTKQKRRLKNKNLLEKGQRAVNTRNNSINASYLSRYQFKKEFIFLNIIIKSTVKNGNIIKSYKILEKLARIVKKKYKITLYKFISRVYKNIVPVVGTKIWYQGKIKYKVPFYSVNNLTHIKMATRWFVSSIRRNYNSKTKLSDRFIDEIIKIYEKKGSSESLKKKREHYLLFFKNRSNIRFLKYFKNKKPKR